MLVDMLIGAPVPAIKLPSITSSSSMAQKRAPLSEACFNEVILRCRPETGAN